MYFQGAWYTLRPARPRRPRDADRSLDVSLLQDELLAPVLKITDVRTDTRIDFVGGARGTAELERLVDSGRAAVAFSLFPVGVDDLMAVSDAGAIMPPKSTWFEPKLRDGLTDSCHLTVLQFLRAGPGDAAGAGPRRDAARSAGAARRRHVDPRDQPSLEDVRGDSRGDRSRHPRAGRRSPRTTACCFCRAAPACSSRWCR